MAGLLGNFKNPFASGGLLSDPNVRLAMGAEMLRGGTLGEQLGNGLNAGAWFSEQNKTKREALEKTNKTVEWLKSINPELAQAVEMGALSGGDAYKMAVEKPKHTEFQDRAAAASQYGVDPNSPEGKAFILSGDYANAATQKPDPYTEQEARSSLKSAFDGGTPRTPWTPTPPPTRRTHRAEAAPGLPDEEEDEPGADLAELLAGLAGVEDDRGALELFALDSVPALAGLDKAGEAAFLRACLER